MNSFPILEFPIIKKMEMKYGFPKSNNNRDEDLKITGYSIIARDITLKNIEKKKQIGD
jgi:hypothetical protein